LLTEVNGEPYAFPLASIARAVTVPRDQVQVAEGRQHFILDGRAIGLVTARQILEVAPAAAPSDPISVVVTGDALPHYRIAVVRSAVMGPGARVVPPPEPLAGRGGDVGAGALMPDGAPVLILDTEGLIRAVEGVWAGSRLMGVRDGAAAGPAKKRKRVLVVDD